MVKTLSLLLFAALTSACPAASYYIRPTAQGGATGADWSNAWSMANLNSNMGSVSAGDTVWIAGGSYTTALNVTSSGTSGSRITFQRPRTTDATATAAAGWSSGFDAQVEITLAADGECIVVAGNYVTVDGRIASGIKVNVPNVSGDPQGVRVTGNNAIVAGVEAAGPGVGATFAGYVLGVTAYGTNTLFTNCWVHGFNQLVTILGATNTTFDACMLADCDAANPGDSHPNGVEYNGGNGLTFRNCDLLNWQVTGIMMWNYSGSLHVYGCLITNVTDLFWSSGTGGDNDGPIYLYNNTFFDSAASIGRANTVQLDPASEARNNLYWEVSMWCGPWCSTASEGVITNRDYEFASTSLQAGNPTSGHNITNGTAPFGSGFQPTNTISATKPRDKGTAISNTGNHVFNVDRYGNTRGADGTWDIGAYEYVSADTTAPTCVISSPASVSSGSSGSYATSSSTITVSGTSDDATATITWSNSRGGAGTATGSDSWSKSGITLFSGGNVLSFVATDASANATTTTLNVTYTAPVSGGSTNNVGTLNVF